MVSGLPARNRRLVGRPVPAVVGMKDRNRKSLRTIIMQRISGNNKSAGLPIDGVQGSVG